MSSQDDLPSIAGWAATVVTAIITVGIAVTSFLKRFFATVTREELRETLRDMLKELGEQRLQLHNENLNKFDELFGQVRDVSMRVARVEGKLQKFTKGD